MPTKEKPPYISTHKPSPSSINEIGVQFCAIHGIDAEGRTTTSSKIGYRIYDNFEESYNFTTFNTLSAMAAAINPDTVIPFIIENFPAHHADRVTLRKHGCTLNGKFVDASSYYRKIYPLYVAPSVETCNDLGTAPIEAGTLVAAIFCEKEGKGTISLRLHESAQMQYKGVVYSTPSKYPVALFRPISDGSSISPDIKILKRNVFVVNREIDGATTTIKTIKDHNIPKPNEIFEFLLSFVDTNV